MRVRLITFAAVLAVPAFAQTIYTWEDSEGLHYTDDASTIPKKAKVEGRVSDPSPASSGLKAEGAPLAVAPVPTAPSSEYEWRDRFIAAHRRIDTVRKSIAALEATLPPRTECVPQPVVPNTRNRGQRTYCQVNALHDQLRVQLAQEAVELKNAELDLEQLDRRASMVAVPREWRRGW